MATTYDFNVTQGALFQTVFEVKTAGGEPYNLSGDNAYKLSGVAKVRYGDSGALIDLKPSGVSGFLESGRFEVTLYASQTQKLPVCQGVYGIEVYSGSGVDQFVEKAVDGKFNVFPEGTNAGVIL